jgi:hypothetical protein
MSTCPMRPQGLRDDIPAPPKFMRHLKIDQRGYPVPWFVDWFNGVPEFRAVDRRKLVYCSKNRVCWTCGRKLFGEEVYVIGPMCAVNRISSEPPSHRECAEYAAVACPFLSKPQMVRREGNMPPGAGEIETPAGVMIARNPGVTLLWYTRSRRILDVRNRPGAGDGILFQIGRPFKTEWYCRGREATRAEVMESIESGLPLLRETAAKHDGPEGVLLLECKITEGLRWVPR